MKKTTLEVACLFKNYDFLGSRDSGEQLREKIIELLSQEGSQVVINFRGIDRISHSFADEVFGLLYVRFGLDVIKQQIQLENAQDNIRSLANFVIKERMLKNATLSKS